MRLGHACAQQYFGVADAVARGNISWAYPHARDVPVVCVRSRVLADSARFRRCLRPPGSAARQGQTVTIPHQLSYAIHMSTQLNFPDYCGSVVAQALYEDVRNAIGAD